MQGWRSGESTRLQPMWLGFNFQTLPQMWVEFVGSLLCTERFFSRYFGFTLSSKQHLPGAGVAQLASVWLSEQKVLCDLMPVSTFL